ncbi:hypothetical protein [Vagococcus zengguangii]|uniref:Uncharacterized protein n=1 Tax=Vagococcus zengguangii TaxID=2571750 RepID=A0A4D7CWZ1_9ENTE|nr:hypothetical protein [Vagococcus zengguangii]QCI86871.1 hypothetical protein FA707_07780 [Vagococcus zengguangii]TLG80477.1 hypothetical protein FE258_05405 [Vagococcus zengguangii]
MLFTSLCLVLNFLPAWLIPKEFPNETITQVMTDALLVKIILAFTISVNMIIPITITLPWMILIALTYAQALADIRYQLISPLLLICQLVLSVGWLNHSLHKLFLCILCYYFFKLITSFCSKTMFGLGDVKLLLMYYYILPLINFCLLIMIATFLALMYVFLLYWVTKRPLSQPLPFVPFIYIGLIICCI